MSAKHTPGPWIYSPDRTEHDCVIHQESAKEKHGYISPENGGVVGSSEWIWLKDADARLIAAAPELLATCKALLDAAPLKYSGKRVQDAMRDARAAIAKAERVES